jgi:hypothetical protein
MSVPLLIAATSSFFAVGEIAELRVESHGDLPVTEVVLTTGDRFVVPGDGDRIRPAGLPKLAVGEEIQVDLVWGSRGWTPEGGGHGLQLKHPRRYALNGVHYGQVDVPRHVSLHREGSLDVGFEATENAVVGALNAWSEVGCSWFSFVYDGATEIQVGEDGVNVLAWEDEEWIFDPAVAGMTIHYFDTSGELPRVVEADILFNGESWTWVDGPGNVMDGTLAMSSVVTHELGHVAGLDHDFEEPTTTMHYAYFGGDWQGTLAGDDRRGLCANYDNGLHECDGDSDCAGLDDSKRTCTTLEEVRVCDEVRDTTGAHCSLSHLNCNDYCVFTSDDLDDGYCTTGCANGESCLDGYRCDQVSLFVPIGTEPATVCVPVEVGSDVIEGPAVADQAIACGCAVAHPNPLSLFLFPGWWLAIRRIDSRS